MDTYHGPVFQIVCRDIADGMSGIEVTCEKYRNLVSYNKHVKRECINYFIGRGYAEYTSDQKTSFNLTANGIAAYDNWFRIPQPKPGEPPKPDFM